MATTGKKSGRHKAEGEKQWAWRPGARIPVPAYVAGPELERIAANDEGEIPHLKPALVVDESRHPDAILHPAFEWRDEIAAERHRENQARALIRNIATVEVVSTGPRAPQDVEVSVQPTSRQRLAYVHVNSPPVGHCYVPTSRAMEDPDLRRQALAEALAQLRGLRRRFENLTELGRIFEAIDKADDLAA